ncbi:MAG TPA: Trm112 family protein [Ignavibacteria bacterium]|jgi:uncharacterized protein YbaR (Trm112 family)
MLNPENLTMLACPLGKKELKLVRGDSFGKEDFLVCTNCGVKYLIVEEIPFLLIDDAILPEGISSPDELKCMKK